jgi:hypothetical protein
VHPFALYLAAINVERNDGSPADPTRRGQYAAVDALPLPEPASRSPRRRLVAILRRRVERAASA